MAGIKFEVPLKESVAVVVKPATAQAIGGRVVVPVQLCKVCGTQNPDKDTSKDCCVNHTVSVDATTIKFNDKGEIVGAVYL